MPRAVGGRARDRDLTPAVGSRDGGGDGGDRTLTVNVLSALPLPVGLRPRVLLFFGRDERDVEAAGALDRTADTVAAEPPLPELALGLVRRVDELRPRTEPHRRRAVPLRSVASSQRGRSTGRPSGRTPPTTPASRPRAGRRPPRCRRTAR